MRVALSKKLFTKHEYDSRGYREDVTVYYYKDLLPVTVSNYVPGWPFRYIQIRLDWLDYSNQDLQGDITKEDDIMSDYDVVNEFRVCECKYDFDMERFVENCEYILNKYIINKAV